jgi:two-component system cell cycle sensor histidine kinase/response regulator CckA
MKHLLEEYGYNVIEAADGEDAINKFYINKDKIQLLLFDVIMPKKNGMEAYEEIRKIAPDIKAIFMSGYSADTVHRKSIVEQSLNIVTKPVSPNVLLREVRKTLDKKSKKNN